jgi:thiamine transport system permease protein
LSVALRRFFAPDRGETVLDAVLILLALLFVAGPMAATVAAGLDADLTRLAGEDAVRRATLTSIVLALLSALLSAALSLALVTMRRALALRRKNGAKKSLLEHAADTGAGFVLVVPPIVIGAGWFLVLRHVGAVFVVAPVMVATVNAVMAIPFAIRAVRPAYDAASERHEKLCAELGISGWTRFRLIDWPSLRRPLATAFAFAMALSLGDLGVIALFGSDTVQTLPYLLLARMGSYRTADAAGLALILGLVCLALVLLADRLARERPA